MKTVTDIIDSYVAKIRPHALNQAEVVRANFERMMDTLGGIHNAVSDGNPRRGELIRNHPLISPSSGDELLSVRRGYTLEVRTVAAILPAVGAINIALVLDKVDGPPVTVLTGTNAGQGGTAVGNPLFTLNETQRLYLLVLSGTAPSQILVQGVERPIVPQHRALTAGQINPSTDKAREPQTSRHAVAPVSLHDARVRGQ